MKTVDLAKEFTVCVFGVPTSGKTTILEYVQKNTAVLQRITRTETIDCVLTLRTEIQSKHYKFVTVAGAVFRPEESISEALRCADIIIYLIDALDLWERDYQAAELEEFTRKAESFGKGWEDVPWIFALNKIDHARTNPIVMKIPRTFRDKVVEISALHGTGMQKLMEQIVACGL
ncbi:MAG: GTPase domain-containing protein [Verrucomicrobiota bacterium]